MKNWKTTLFGTLFALATTISVSPDMVWAWFPQDECGALAWNIIRVSNILVFVLGAATATVMKDRNVTGGTVGASPEANERVEEDVPEAP